MKRLKKYFISILLIFISILLLTSCTWQKRYFDYDCIWYSEDPYIKFCTSPMEGIIVLDEIKYDANLSYANDGTSIEFYVDNIDGEFTIWEADTVVKKGVLYMTVTLDNVSNYLGETIELVQMPVEDYTEN